MQKSFKFNPGFQTDMEAIDGFVVRKAELQYVLDRLAGSDPAAHVIIVGPRGAGKTTLCRRVLAEARTRDDLVGAWMPIVLGEESYSVTTPGEFLLECLFHLIEDPNSAIDADDYSQALRIESEAELRAHCYNVLRQVTETTGRRYLAIVENLHMIVRDQLTTDEHDLLEILRDNSVFGVVATAVRSDDDSDLLDGFDYLQLKPLELEECHQLWSWLTRRKVDKSRIRPLQILTGGSPRLLHILAEFMKTPSLHDLMENLNYLIDQNTEYFKSQLDALPSQERKVFVALLEVWDPGSAKQIAEAARVSVNTASSLLNRLSDRGAVVKRPGTGRAVLYQAAERLFNIYYLMRRRSHPSSRVRALVAFMTQYYDRDELVDTTAKLALEACGVDPSGRSDYHSAYSAILAGQPEAIRSEILKLTPADFLESLRREQSSTSPIVLPSQQVNANRPVANDNGFEAVLSEAHVAYAEEDFDRAVSLLEAAAALDPKSFEPWLFLAAVQSSAELEEDAVASARRAVDLAPDLPITHAVLGKVLAANDEIDEAIRSLEFAIAEDAELQFPFVELARIKMDADKDGEALELFRKAAALDPLPEIAASRFAHLLSREDDSFDEARLALEATLQEDEGASEALRSLAQLYLDEDRGDDAVQLLRSHAEQTGDEDQWSLLVSFLRYALDDPDGAADAAQSAVERKEASPRIFKLLAEMRDEEGAASQEIVDLARSVIETFEPNVETHTIAGQIFELAGEYDAAAGQFRIAAEQPGAGGFPLYLLARVLQDDLHEPDQAEEVLRRALADEAAPCGPYKDLAKLRIHKGDDSEAGSLLDHALGRNDRCVCSLVLRAEVAGRAGDRERALQHLDKALEISPAYAPALAARAQLSRGDEESAALIERAISTNPDDPTILLARGRLGGRSEADRIQDLEEAIALDPDLAEARLELTQILSRSAKPEAALEQLGEALQMVPSRMEIIPNLVDAVLELVRAGHSVETLELLSGEFGRYVEPLIVALKLHHGEKPVVASEILEVAKDILAQLQREDKSARRKASKTADSGAPVLEG